MFFINKSLDVVYKNKCLLFNTSCDLEKTVRFPTDINSKIKIKPYLLIFYSVEIRKKIKNSSMSNYYYVNKPRVLWANINLKKELFSYDKMQRQKLADSRSDILEHILICFVFSLLSIYIKGFFQYDNHQETSENIYLLTSMLKNNNNIFDSLIRV